MSERIEWGPVIETAASIVREYDTQVTLRQLFYRLVSIGLIPNKKVAYTHLSKLTAEARRAGTFPGLVDRTRTIHSYRDFQSPAAAREWLRDIYRVDRTEGQNYTLYLGVEKHGIVNQLQSWFGRLGLPVVSLGGYSSQSYIDEIASDVYSHNRTAILIYAGDFDPSGQDIQRDFVKRAGCFAHVERIALNEEQILEHNLPVFYGKKTDTRAAGFIREYGELVQVELDALAPDVLRELYSNAISNVFDYDVYSRVMEREAAEREELAV